MSRRKPGARGRLALSISPAPSPLARRAQVSPSHSIPPKFGGGDKNSEHDAMDLNLDEDLVQEIRTLVKKEQYLETLENQLRDQVEDSDGFIGTSKFRDDQNDKASCSRDTKRIDRKAAGQRTAKQSQPAIQPPSKEEEMAQKHFCACFVEVNPVQLRDIRSLILSSQGLNTQHLRTLSKNLFLFSELRSVNLANNQLDDSGCKEIRDLMSCSGLQVLDLSRNLLGKLAARTICERLRHQVKLLSLDLHGNIFFADGGSAVESARLFATAIAVNSTLLSFRLSAIDQPTQNATQPAPRARPVKDKPTTAAIEFSECLAEQLQQRGKHSSLQSLSLCYAEISRKVVLNTVAMANRLTALDLSFAFVGIPGAQVVAAALRLQDYATLTQLNMRCNRTKSMGARAILGALRENDRLTDLNLSHNGIRADAATDVITLLAKNHVLTRLDLSKNEIIPTDPQQDNTVLNLLRDAIIDHRALRTLGMLHSLGANNIQANVLQASLDRNCITDDQVLLDSISGKPPTSKSMDASTAGGKQQPLSPRTEIDLQSQRTTVWRSKIVKSGRYSLKWKMAVKKKQSSSKDESPMIWRVLVHRKCDVQGSIEDEAAAVCFPLDGDGSTYTLNSAVAYCDSGDTLSLVLGFTNGNFKDVVQQVKLFVKDVALIQHHPKDKRHLLASIPGDLVGTTIQWQMKAKRAILSTIEDQQVHPSSFLWEGIIHRVYVHTSGTYRLLARVQLPVDLSVRVGDRFDALKTRYWWQLLRSSCWDPHTSHLVVEGTYPDLHGVVRDSREVVFYLPPLEWIAGEYVQLSVATCNDDVLIQLLDVQVFLEITHWERASALLCLNVAS